MDLLTQIKRLLGNVRLRKRLPMFTSLILSNIFPKKKGLIVFGTSSGNFADNSKYLYLELQNEENIDPIWVSSDQKVVDTLRSNGYRAQKSDAVKTKYIILRAEFAIFDHSLKDFDSWLPLGTKKLNLWHGFPLKYIRTGEKPKGKLIQLISEKYSKLFFTPDYFLRTDKKYGKFYREAFNTAKPIYAGYPRNDVFNQDIEGKDILATDIDKEKYVLYMPTWRENQKLDELIDLDILDDIFEALSYTLILKPHPYTEIDKEFENITVINKNKDLYPALNSSEALITDYSSVMFDYMHTENPIILFQFDKKEYDKVRGLNKEIKSLQPGKEVKTIEQLEDALQNLDDINTDYKEKIEEVFESRKEGLQAPHILDQID